MLKDVIAPFIVWGFARLHRMIWFLNQSQCSLVCSTYTEVKNLAWSTLPNLMLAYFLRALTQKLQVFLNCFETAVYHWNSWLYY